jgi:hypothetical protein
MTVLKNRSDLFVVFPISVEVKNEVVALDELSIKETWQSRCTLTPLLYEEESHEIGELSWAE